MSFAEGQLAKTWLRLTVFFSLGLQLGLAKTDLWLGAFLTVNISAGGWQSAGILPAIEMAVDDVNNSTDILNDYTLKLSWRDTRCQRGYGIKQFVELVENPHKIMLLGGGCSVATEATGEASHYWNLVQIAFSASSMKLSDKSKYPLLFRTCSAESFGNPSRIAFMKHFNWKRVATIVQDEGVFTMTMQHFRELLDKEGFTVLLAQSITADSYYQVQNLKKTDARIIVGMFYSRVARKVFCQAYKSGMYGSSYVWILPGWYEKQWWGTRDADLDCTPEQIKEAAGHYIAVTEGTRSTDPGLTVSGETATELTQRYSREINKTSYAWNEYNVFGYDAVWAAALTLNSSIETLKSRGKRLEDITYNDSETAQLFKSLLFNLTFLGMSGRIKFDDSGDRLGVALIEQRQGDREVTVANYDLVDQTLNFSQAEAGIYWKGGVPPADQMPVMKKLVPVSLGLFVAFSCFAALGILMAVAFLVFNVVHGKKRLIKMSSPRLNNITVVGCIFIYLSVILYGVDGKFLGEKGYTAVCQAQTWIVCIGFTLAFGAMFAKTWRVHALFMQRVQRRVIRDTRLLMMVAFFLVMDVIVLSSWQIMDPLKQRIIYQAITFDENTRIAEEPYLEQCSCERFVIWASVIFAYKGLVLVFGAFLAWETRNVTFPVLNDSKNIGVSVYTVVLSCLVCLPVISFITGMPNLTFTLSASLALICSSITLCLMFIPKILMLRKPDQEANERPTTIYNRQVAPVDSKGRSDVFVSGTYAVDEPTPSTKQENVSS